MEKTILKWVALNLSDTYAVSPDYANWYLNPDLKTLYILDYDRGITGQQTHQVSLDSFRLLLLSPVPSAVH